MNLFRKHIIIAAAAATIGVSAMAQDNSSASSAVMRRGSNDRNNPSATAQPGVTQRMESFYQDPSLSDADMQWMKVIYRRIDLNNPKNAALYYPEDIIDGQENLFRIIMRLVADGKVPVYEYFDGREIFDDKHRVNVGEMLKQFYIPYELAKGSTEKNPRYVIDEYDVPTSEVLNYYAIERWEFDSRSNRMRTRIDAICPVLIREGDFGDSLRYPMFWVKLENLRPYLAQQYIFVDDDNNLPKYTYDDFFAMNMYEGDIYKTRNLMNKSMAQLYPDPDDLKRAQDSIQNRLDSFDKNLWVPSREEVIAAREAREAAAKGDTISIKDRGDSSKAAPTRSARSKKQPKVKEPKQPKQSNNNSNAVRSVRRRK